MDIQVNKHQLERVVIKWLNKYFGNLKTKINSKYNGSIFYVDSNNEIIMKYSPTNGHIYVNYYKVWSKIELLFHIRDIDIELIITMWLKDTYKINVERLLMGLSFSHFSLD
jgi:hypothetical protein